MRETPIVIREYRDQDHDAVVAIWGTVFPMDPSWNEPVEFIRRRRSVQHDLFWVAQDGADIVGTVLAGYDGVRGWIYHLAVDPSRRRRGIARLLMQAAEDRLEHLGCPKINLQVRMNNTSVVEFYKTLGYSVEERVKMGKPLGKYSTRIER
jgi:ribosomal protein S18 acetylase RimI-like enzyme